MSGTDQLQAPGPEHPAGTAHGFVGAGTGPCTMITVGARNAVPAGETWGIYEPDPVAARHKACVEVATMTLRSPTPTRRRRGE